MACGTANPGGLSLPYGRQAEARFGARTAERLSASLRREDDPRRLDAIAMAVVRCETGEELIRQARQGSS